MAPRTDCPWIVSPGFVPSFLVRRWPLEVDLMRRPATQTLMRPVMVEPHDVQRHLHAKLRHLHRHDYPPATLVLHRTDEPVPARNAVSLGIIDFFWRSLVACPACEPSLFPCSTPSLLRFGAGEPSNSRSLPCASSSQSFTITVRNALACDPSIVSSGPACPSCGRAGGIHS
jgi:hypothetical protein